MFVLIFIILINLLCETKNLTVTFFNIENKYINYIAKEPIRNFW